MLEARKGVDLPYDSRQMRTELERRYGPANVTSTTVPAPNNKNVKLAGSRHPVTGVVFDKKGFPIFDDIAKYDTKIDSSKFKSSDYKGQMKLATKELSNAINSGKIDKKQFRTDQLEAIKKGNEKIPGYTWHHHQDTGRMQLVPEWEHSKTGHVGGDSISKGR